MRTLLIPAAAAAMLLGGCAAWRPIEQNRIMTEAESQAQRACRTEARNDPSVRIFDRQVNPMRDPFAEQARVDRERRLAEDRVFRDCLRRAGYADPGGVEPIIPR